MLFVGEEHIAPTHAVPAFVFIKHTTALVLAPLHHSANLVNNCDKDNKARPLCRGKVVNEEEAVTASVCCQQEQATTVKNMLKCKDLEQWLLVPQSSFPFCCMLSLKRNIY